jgi:hypothetical protein
MTRSEERGNLPGASLKKKILQDLEEYARRHSGPFTYELETICDGYIQACLDFIERRKVV